MRLLDVLFPPRETQTLVRTIDLETLSAKVVSFPVHEGAVIALLPYRDPTVHALIIETKFYGNQTAITLLGSVLGEYLLEYIAEEIAIEKQRVVLVPVPLSGKRKRERGYNQVEEVCRVAQQILGTNAVVDSKVLTRIRHTTPQTKLGKEARETNIVGAFSADDLNPAYLYIVVDDVYTTGTTLIEAMQTLTRAGATRVRGLALAH